MRKVLVILLAAGLLTACGSTRTVTVLDTGTVARAQVGQRTLNLPAAHDQNQCEVAKGPAEIIFFSTTVHVARLCRAQISESGWRPGYQRAAASPEELLECYLRTRSAEVVASVFDVRGGRTGHGICASLVASHDWQTGEAAGT
jgi:hypothetical protein